MTTNSDWNKLSKAENLSPFSNLFRRQIGNVYARLRIAETICEKLMSKFLELEANTTPVDENSSSDRALLVSLSERLAKSMSHNLELDSTVNKLELELDKFRTSVGSRKRKIDDVLREDLSLSLNNLNCSGKFNV